MTSVPRSIFFSALERYASLALFFISTAVLSRLLTPREFGIYAVVGAVTTVVAASSQEFGGPNYLVQKASLTEASIRTAFTVTFCLSVAIGAALALLGGMVGTLFGEPGVATGIEVASLSFLITPFSMTVIALLRRKMRFGVIAAANLAGNCANAVVSIALAATGYSYVAPIWGLVAGSAVQAAYVMAACAEFRIFRPSFSGYPDVVRFGLYSSGVVLTNVFYGSAPQLFLARVLDFAAVGLYSRAVNVTQVFDKLVVQAISPVIMPAIFVQTKGGADLKRIYLDAIELLTVLHWPFLILVSVLAKPLIAFWLGPTWLEVVPLVRLLCIAYLSMFAACLTYPILVVAGSVRDALISSLVSLPPSLLVILGASFLGVEAVAASALLTLPFQAAVAIYFISRHLRLRPVEIFYATRRSAVVTVATAVGAVPGVLMEHYAVAGAAFGVVAGCVGGGAAWLGAVAATRHPLLPKLKSALRDSITAPLGVGLPVPVSTVRPDRTAAETEL